MQNVCVLILPGEESGMYKGGGREKRRGGKRDTGTERKRA